MALLIVETRDLIGGVMASPRLGGIIMVQLHEQL
jgi:hypothetical protein